MTIRDFIDSGIQFQGNVLIRELNQDTGNLTREILLSLALKDRDDILDREIRHLYPSHFEWDHWDYCIEVAAERLQ